MNLTFLLIKIEKPAQCHFKALEELFLMVSSNLIYLLSRRLNLCRRRVQWEIYFANWSRGSSGTWSKAFTGLKQVDGGTESSIWPTCLEAAQERDSRHSKPQARQMEAHTKLTQITSMKLVTYSLCITYSNWWPLD